MKQVFCHTARTRRVAPSALASLVACCLVLLQLATALHFALVPHGFSAGFGGFVHEQPALGNQRGGPSQGARVAAHQPSLVAGAASCAPESCPIGFAGPHSVLLAAPQTSGLLGLGTIAESAPQRRLAVPRARALLNAPKTSPPLRV